MRTAMIALRAVLVCSAAGAALTGCSGGSTAPAERSAGQLLDDANRTMSALGSVTVDADTVSAGGSRLTTHMTTDLKSKCTNRAEWAAAGTLEQIRIGDTDYVRPDAAYLKAYLEKTRRDAEGSGVQGRWIKSPSSRAQPGDGLASCPYSFTSFGEADKGHAVSVGGRKAIEVEVHDRSERNGSFTFSIATEGKPYLLKVSYRGTDYETSTSFSGFDEPLAIRPPAAADVVDGAGLS
ncbi:hypothetical protein [Streptomyces xanthochromogenes]|uniref:hypothetical protein n=1 Tax=Streptomyces xanthochromogenes TaxID=67384 RepID=UPI00380F7957